MRVGVVLPQGWYGEFDDDDPIGAYRRVIAIAGLVERLGFDSVWTGEHVTTKWNDDRILFDCVVLSAAVAQAVPRVGIGFTVLNSTFRNPTLTAKTASTLDVISGGRLTLGLGAGFRRVEAVAFGYEFPPMRERLEVLGEHLEIISRLTTAGAPALSFTGRHARAEAAINRPQTAGSSHIPLLIGGHGPEITFRLAARWCDEVNIDVLPDELAGSIGVLHERCAEIGRDPATLAVSTGLSASMPWSGLRITGRQRMMRPGEAAFIDAEKMLRLPSRAEALATCAAMGLNRVMVGAPGLADTDESLYELREDCVTAGVQLEALAS